MIKRQLNCSSIQYFYDLTPDADSRKRRRGVSDWASPVCKATSVLSRKNSYNKYRYGTPAPLFYFKFFVSLYGAWIDFLSYNKNLSWLRLWRDFYIKTVLREVVPQVNSMLNNPFLQLLTVTIAGLLCLSIFLFTLQSCLRKHDLRLLFYKRICESIEISYKIWLARFFVNCSCQFVSVCRLWISVLVVYWIQRIRQRF